MKAALRHRLVFAWRAAYVSLTAFGLVISTQTSASTLLRAASHDGFGRLAFEWSTPVQYDMSQDGRRVIIKFSQSVETSLAPLHARLGQYVGAATLAEDKRSLVLDLTDTFTVKTALYEDRIVAIDLIGNRQAGDRIATPRAGTAKAGQRAGGHAVRFGEHDGFDRIAIDWPASTAYSVDVTGSRAIVSFDNAVRLDLDGMPQEKTRYLRKMTAVDGARAPLTVDLADGVRLRHFRAGNKLVLDLMPVQESRMPSHTDIGRASRIEPAAGQAEHPTSSPAVSAGRVELRRTEQGVSFVFAWQHPIGAAVFERAGYIWAVFDTPEPLDLSGVRAAPRSVVSDIRTVDAPGARVVRILSLPGFHPLARREGAIWIVDLVQRAAPTDGGLQVRTDGSNGAINRWFVPVLMPPRSIELIDPEVGDRLQVVPLPGQGQLLRSVRETAFFRMLPTAQGIAVEPRHDAVTLRSTSDGIEIVDRRDRPLQAATQDRPVPATIAAKPKPLNEPAAKAALVPVKQASSPEPAPSLEPGVTGNAQAAKQTPSPEASAAAGRPRSTVLSAVRSPDRRLFDLSAWGNWDKPYDEARLARLDALIDAPEKGRNKKRLELASFFFARARAPEALGLLDVALQNDEQIARDIGFRAMRGALTILAGHAEEAAQDLADPAMNEYSDGIIWQAALAAEKGDTNTAASGFATTHATVATYPDAIRRRLARLAVEALAAEKLDTAAESYAVMLESLADTPERMSEISYFRGRIALAVGDSAEALRHLEAAAKGPDRRSRAEASFHLTEMAIADKSITPKEAADRFEKLRFAWRGGPFEINLLKRLGQSYLAAGDRKRGLEALQYAGMRLENGQDKEIKALMSEAFEGLFLGEEGARSDPMAAISIFEAYRDLVPDGDRGNRILRSLADRLIEVDLLDRARDLLATLMRDRLTGEAKAEAGYRLALVEMLDRNPEGAIKALSDSDMPGLPPAMIKDRRLLVAESFAAKGQDQDAMKALLDDQGTESERLRADIHARNGRWLEAARIQERLLASAGDNLAPEDLRSVLNWGVALAMLGDNAGLEQLRNRFAARMGKGAEAAAFAVLTSTPGGNRSYENIAAQVRLAQKLEADFATYRRRLKAPEGATN